MSVLIRTMRPIRDWTRSEASAVIDLENGMQMDQPTFHELYKRTPEGFKAELIGGTVYVMASPVSLRHGRPHARAVYWLTMYSDRTLGTEALDDTTNILGKRSEPQPDTCLCVLPEYGGQVSFDKDGYVKGAAELVVEVANSTAAIDLGKKKRDYEEYGVQEYVVVLAKEESVLWFLRENDAFRKLEPEGDGNFHSLVFPGLRLDPRGLFAPTTRHLTAALNRGLATSEHAEYVLALQDRAKKHRKRRGK